MQNKVKDRNTGIELLRILAMFLIVYGHFISHGGGFVYEDSGSLYYLEGIIDSFSAFKVNIFILITGFFLIGKENFNIKQRLSKLWENEMFYSITIMIIFVLCGMDIGIVDLIKSIIPTISYRYWFVTTYVALILLIPVLNKAFQRMDKKQYQKSLLIMLVITSVWQTLMPFVTTVDNHQGYSLLWFIVVYAIGGYIRRYYSYKKIPKKKLFLIYITCSLIQFAYAEIFTYIEKKTNMIMDIPYYNSLFVICSSVMIFLIFFQINFKGNLGKAVNYISGSVISIYLISDNPLIRDILYTNILHISKYQNRGLFSILSITGAVVLTFGSCLIIDIIKRWIMDKSILKLKKYKKETN